MPWFKLSLVLVDYLKNFRIEKAKWSVVAVRARHSFTGHCKKFTGHGKALRGLAKLYVVWQSFTWLGKSFKVGAECVDPKTSRNRSSAKNV